MIFLSRARPTRPSIGMGPKHALVAVVVALVVACGVVSGEPIKPPVAAQTCDAGACGPAPLQPNYACGDGSIAGPTGRCILNQDGTCGWEIVACPSSDGGPSTGDAGCTDALCGPRPLVADQQCDGGATSGERCLPSTTSSTACAWVYVPCP